MKVKRCGMYAIIEDNFRHRLKDKGVSNCFEDIKTSLILSYINFKEKRQNQVQLGRVHVDTLSFAFCVVGLLPYWDPASLLLKNYSLKKTSTSSELDYS